MPMEVTDKQMEAKCQQRQCQSHSIKNEKRTCSESSDSEADLPPARSSWACDHPGCQEIFETSCELCLHRRSAHNTKMTACPHCGKEFKTASYARVHAGSCQLNTAAPAADAHGNEAAVPLRHCCKACGGSYAHELSYKAHLHYCRIPQPEKSRCQICSATFGRLSDLKRHVELTHNRVKRLACHVCFKPFGRTSHLRRHLELLHSEGRMCRKRRSKSNPSPPALTPEPAPVVESLLCPFSECGLELPGVAELQDHLAAHCDTAHLPAGQLPLNSPDRSFQNSSQTSSQTSSQNSSQNSSQTSSQNSSQMSLKDSTQQSPPRKKKKGKGKDRKAPRYSTADPYMCPLNRICRSSFSRYQHLTRHLSTTHKHLFESPKGRSLLESCTTLRLMRPCRGRSGDGGVGGDKARDQLRRSAMTPATVEVTYDSLIGD